MNIEIKIFLTAEDAAAKIAEEIVKIVFRNSGDDRDSYISLSGGSTPKYLFSKISSEYADKIDWKRVHLFWGDERCVPPADEQSNYGMANRYLINNINIPESNVHRTRGEEDPAAESARIAKEIKKIVPVADGLPRFDLNILGLGEDGHTASLFPGQKLQYIAEGIAGVAVHPESGQKRISLTSNVLSNAVENIFMVTGKKKAEIIFEVLKGRSAGNYPAAEIKAAEILRWYLDEGAAGKIKLP